MTYSIASESLGGGVCFQACLLVCKGLASAHGPFLFIYAGRGRSRAAGKTSADAYVFNVILHDFDMS